MVDQLSAARILRVRLAARGADERAAALIDHSEHRIPIPPEVLAVDTDYFANGLDARRASAVPHHPGIAPDAGQRRFVRRFQLAQYQPFGLRYRHKSLAAHMVLHRLYFTGGETGRARLTARHKPVTMEASLKGKGAHMEQQERSGAFSRTQRLLGAAAMDKLRRSRVAVFGIGGVGSFAAEAIARCGVGAMALIDNDTVTESNINRQLIATRDSIGQSKAVLMKARIAQINPDCEAEAILLFYTQETAGEVDLSKFDYIVDAIDTVSSKLTLIERAEGGGRAHHQQHGCGQQAGPQKVRGRRHL